MDKNTIFALCCLSGCLLPMGIHADTADQPDIELLEFLAEWQSDQGEWLDPLLMQDMIKNEYDTESKEVPDNE